MFDLFAPGTMLGRNELLATIGEGGMARVILARQRGPMGFEKVVVVKVIHPRMAEDKAAVGMLLDEARVAAQINHQNVVQTYELGEAHGTFYIVMEYLAGESLQRVLKNATLGASLDPRMAARVIADAAGGLHAAHELQDSRGRNINLVHRDVSLGNIIVLYNGCVKVVDFGIAKTHDRVSTTTQHGQLKGKYAYMSPEQVRNEPLDRRTDVFSLGVVLWECLALRRLFHAENVPATLMQIISSDRIAPSAYRPEVPAALDEIVMRALAVDPNQRYQTTLEMKRALEDAIWQSRCDSSDVSMYMTAVFGDRIRKRQRLLTSAQTMQHDAVMLEPHDEQDTSGLRPAPVLPPRPMHQQPVQMPPQVQMQMHVPPPALPPMLPRQMQRPAPRVERKPRTARRLLMGVVAAGLATGVGLGIPLVTGDGSNKVAYAKTAPIAPKTPPHTAGGIDAKAPTKVAVRGDKKIVDVKPSTGDEIVTSELPQLRSKLRPEHMEPLRIAALEPKDTEATGTRKPSTPSNATNANAAKIKELLDHGSELHLAGKFSEAATAYKQALALNPNLASAHRGLGLIYQRMGFNAMAVDEYRRYLALAPKASDTTTVQQRIEQLGGGQP